MKHAARIPGGFLVGAGVALALSSCGAPAHRTANTHTGGGPSAVKRRLTTATPEQRALKADVVARIGSHSITWMQLGQATRFEVVRSSSYSRARSVPLGLVPDPPSYRRCIAYLAAGHAAADAALLKTKCGQEYRHQRRNALERLINDNFIHNEGSRRRVRVTTAEIYSAAVARFRVSGTVLHALEIPSSVQREVLEVEPIAGKIAWSMPVHRRLLRIGHETTKVAREIDAETQRFLAEMTRLWTPRTVCRVGLVVRGCSEYREESASG